MLSLTSCRYPFRLMRRCFLGKWICLDSNKKGILIITKSRNENINFSKYLIATGKIIRIVFDRKLIYYWLVGWLFRFYGISTFLGYLTPNPLLCKCNILICRCMQKHIQHNKDQRTQFFRKIYLSLYLKRFERVTKGNICKRWVGDWTELLHIDPPNLLAIIAFLSRALELLNRGPGGLASAGTWFTFQHLYSNWSELPVAGVI